jgi:hypothetical protein
MTLLEGNNNAPAPMLWSWQDATDIASARNASPANAVVVNLGVVIL